MSKKKKKKGSALIMVIAFSLVFTVIAGAAATAVVSTYKSNSVEKKFDTLYYNAEAGIEKALAKANAGEYNEASFVVGSTKNSSNGSGYEFSIDDATVKFSVSKVDDPKDGTYLKVISRATRKNNLNEDVTREVSAKLKKWASSMDLFKYSICGKGVETDSSGGGSLNWATGRINSSKKPHIQDAAGGDIAEGIVDSSDFSLPEFDSSKIPYSSAVSIDVTDPSHFDSYMTGNSIKKVEYKLTSGAMFTIYLVNTDKLTLKFNGGGTLENKMILTQGIVNIETGVSAIQLTNSSIIGEEVTVKKGNMHLTFTPLDENHPDGGATNSVLTQDISKALINGTFIDASKNELKTQDGRGISYYAPNMSVSDSSTINNGGSFSASDYE